MLVFRWTHTLTLCCVKSGYVRRHYTICDEMRYLLTAAGLRCSSEIYVDQQRSLRIDLLVDRFYQGQSLALDVHITHALSHRIGTAALVEAEQQKSEKYERACQLLGWSFSPIVLDTFGNLGPKSLKTVQRIISLAVGEDDFEHSVEAMYYLQRLSLSLQRAVCRQLILSLP